MKLNNITKLVGTIVITIAAQLSGHAQTYNVQQNINPGGPGLYDSGNLLGGTDWGAGTVSNTVVINPSGYTIDVSGSIYLAPFQQTLSVTETQSVISVIQDFPNPP